MSNTKKGTTVLKPNVVTVAKDNTPHNITIGYPIPKNNKGSEFTQLEDILAHLEGESTGLYMIGRNGMWHGGIHITNATTPWCALSGKSITENIDFPVPYAGDQFVRCMADGEVVAYRVCQDYLPIKWGNEALSFSGSFLLVRHYIQPGKTAKSGLHFYTLYMHLAPHSAYYTSDDKPLWTVQDKLTAYQPEWLLSASYSHTHRAGTMPKGALIEWDAKDNNFHTQAFNQRKYGLVTFKGLTKAMKNKGITTSLKEGQKYWILVDNNNIKLGGEAIAQPAWWPHSQPPLRDVMQYDRVVCPKPYPIHAGDAVGHLGYCQVPKDGGHESRYQVHIECFSMDDNLPNFLTDPEKVGHDNPQYLKYSPGLALYKKESKTGAFTKEDRVTKGSGILPLSKVPVESHKTKAGVEQYYQLKEGFVLKSEQSPERLSQYDLAKLGFTLIKDSPDSFDHLNGKTQPKGLVRSIYEQLLHCATMDIRVSHALVAHNYQRLLDKIDGHQQGKYSPEEYRRAIHNPSYRDELYKMIVRHPSDWFHKKEDSIWQTFLTELKKEAPEWKTYSEDFIDKMAWMQEVTTEKLGPELWHMHPLRFLAALREVKRQGWAHSKFAEFLGSVESKNDYTAYNVHVTYKAHYKTNLTSMTIGQVMTSQGDRSSNGLFATGRFQIIPDSLKDAIRKLNLDVNALYDEAMQDRIFEEYLIKLKRSAIIDFLEGNGSVEDAIYAWAKEFASAGVRKGKEITPSKTEFEMTPDRKFKLDSKGRKIPKKRVALVEGVSYYSGDGVNKAHIKPDDMVRVLEESKNVGK